MNLPLLRRGDTGTYVLSLQVALQRQGFFKGHPKGNFQALTEEAVIYFQQTHADADGSPLEVDGIVGDKTWWAIAHPSGVKQKAGLLKGKKIKSVIPDGITGMRLDLLQFALGERLKNVHETPDGSNAGQYINDYLDNIGLDHQPWCYAFWGYGMETVFGQYPFNSKHGHVKTGWEEAKRAGAAFPKESYEPVPGDAMVMLYKKDGRFTGTGHISIVARVSEDGKTFNTFGGNEGNRVKFGTRSVSSSSIVGFINLFGDSKSPPKYTRGVLEASAVGNQSTR